MDQQFTSSSPSANFESGPGQTFIDVFERAMTVAPDREALVCGDRRITYRQLKQRLEQLHAVLHDAGVRRGDRVAIISANSDAMVELYCGIPMAGYVQVPLNFRWIEPEFAHAIEDSGAQILVTDRDPGELSNLFESPDALNAKIMEALSVLNADAAPKEDSMAEVAHEVALFVGGQQGLE